MSVKAPWVPAKYDAETVAAFKALSKGEATPGQQGMALRWIIEDAARTYDISYRSDADGGDRDTAFAEGARFVGLQVVKLVNMPGGMISKLRDQNGGK